jgi:hypothetical protein
LRDAGEHHCDIEVRARGRLRGSAQRSCAELSQGVELLGGRLHKIVEAVMPERPDPDEQRFLSCLPAQLSRQIEDALDVIVIDMAHHQHVDRECVLLSQSTLRI